MCKQAMHEIRQKIHLCKKEHESARNPLNELCRNRKNGEEAFASSPHCSLPPGTEKLFLLFFLLLFVGPSNYFLILFVLPVCQIIC